MKTPFLFDIVDWAYHGVMDNMPKELQEKSIGSAFVLGLTGNYILIKSVQYVSNKFFSKEFNNEILPSIEGLCIAGVVLTPLVYSFVDPIGIKELMQQHPTYTSGMIGAGLSAILTSQEDIIKKKF